MKTKYFVVLLVVVLFAALAIPALAGNAAKDPTQPAAPANSALLPVSGASVSASNRAPLLPRLWSGEILNSDGNSPDLGEKIAAPAIVTTASVCSSEDAPVQKYGGCIE